MFHKWHKLLITFAVVISVPYAGIAGAFAGGAVVNSDLKGQASTSTPDSTLYCRSLLK